jgi:hypothetical protein
MALLLASAVAAGAGSLTLTVTTAQGSLNATATVSDAEIARLQTAITGAYGLSSPTNQQIVNRLGLRLFSTM